jgi:transcriptional regulator with XRE-family HTH domain
MDEHNQQSATTFEEFLVQALNERRLSITALARGSRLSKQAIHSYLNGARPTLESCRKLAFFLGVPLGEIISLVHRDVDGKQLQSLIELYLELPKEERHLAEGFMFLLAQNAKRHDKT